jgi:protein-S-isoprenylcysteine O-methyltransferase Ste14
MTGYAVDVFIIIILFAFFGFVHSFLASYRAKQIVAERYDNLIAFYRLLYNLGSLILFYLVYQSLPKPRPIIYDLPHPYDLIILIPQFLSLAGFLWTFKYFSLIEFLGISQIDRWLHKEYNTNELDEKLTLKIEGPYRFCRHPLYLFSILFLVFRPEMDLFYFTSLICIIGYFYIGSIYEEKKLIATFGNTYEDYQKSVPRILPVKFRRYRPKMQ